MDIKFLEIEKRIWSYLDEQIFRNRSVNWTIWEMNNIVYSKDAIKKYLKPLDRTVYQAIIVNKFQFSKAEINNVITSDFSLSREKILIRFKKEIEDLFNSNLSTYSYFFDKKDLYFQSQIIEISELEIIPLKIKRKGIIIDYYDLRPITKLLIHIKILYWLNEELTPINEKSNKEDENSTVKQQMIIAKYLGIFDEIESNNTKKAEFLSLFLNRGKDNIRQNYSNFYSRIATIENLQFAIDLFKKAGLQTPIEKIKSDTNIKNSEKELKF